MKWPGSPQRQQAGPGFPANLVAHHHLVLSELDGQSSDAGRWHWTHCAVFLGSRAINCSSTTRSMIWSTPPSPANHPSAAGVPELVSHHEGPAVLPQLQRTEALAVLLGAPADPLEDGSF